MACLIELLILFDNWLHCNENYRTGGFFGHAHLVFISLQGRHALVYDINTASETWEWVNLKEVIALGDFLAIAVVIFYILVHINLTSFIPK